MKNTPRIHRNGAAKAAPLQRKNRIRNAAKHDPLVPPEYFDEIESCICIYESNSRKPMQIVPLTNEELTKTLTRCLEPGSPQKTSVEFIAAAIREKLRGVHVGESLAEIEDAKNEAVLILASIEAGDLNPMIERIINGLQSSIEKAFATLRGESVAE